MQQRFTDYVREEHASICSLPNFHSALIAAEKHGANSKSPLGKLLYNVDNSTDDDLEENIEELKSFLVDKFSPVSDLARKHANLWLSAIEKYAEECFLESDSNDNKLKKSKKVKKPKEDEDEDEVIDEIDETDEIDEIDEIEQKKAKKLKEKGKDEIEQKKSKKVKKLKEKEDEIEQKEDERPIRREIYRKPDIKSGNEAENEFNSKSNENEGDGKGDGKGGGGEGSGDLY
jgi:hypothetical protein